MPSESGTGTVTALDSNTEGATQPGHAAYQVVVMVGPLLTAHTVAQPELVIGRSHQADIRIVAAAISRRHLRLCFGPPLTAEDLGSRNGSFAAGARLPPSVPVELASGVPIAIGKASVLVRQVGAAEPQFMPAVRFPPADVRRMEGDPAVLALGPQAAWFRVADGSSVDLTRYPTLRRLLFTLMFHRLRAPGEPVSPGALIAAVWPDKRSRPDALRNRLYASLSRLRSMGLDGLIAREARGYCLAPDLRIDQHT